MSHSEQSKCFVFQKNKLRLRSVRHEFVTFYTASLLINIT